MNYQEHYNAEAQYILEPSQGNTKYTIIVILSDWIQGSVGVGNCSLKLFMKHWKFLSLPHISWRTVSWAFVSGNGCVVQHRITTHSSIQGGPETISIRQQENHGGAFVQGKSVLVQPVEFLNVQETALDIDEEKRVSF